MSKKPVQRTQWPVRHRQARSDGRVGSLQSTMERTFGLARGSVLLVKPDGRAMRPKAFVGTFRKRWKD